MNIFELIIVGVLVLLVYFVASLIGAKFGAVGYLLGALLGAAFFAICHYTLKRLIAWTEEHRPRHPSCRNGCCKSNDYTVIRASTETTAFVCKCGFKYIAVRDRFLEVNSEEYAHPYKKRDGRGIWVDDLSESNDRIIGFAGGTREGDTEALQ